MHPSSLAVGNACYRSIKPPPSPNSTGCYFCCSISSNKWSVSGTLQSHRYSRSFSAASNPGNLSLVQVMEHVWGMFLCRVNSGTSQALQGTPVCYWTCYCLCHWLGESIRQGASKVFGITLDICPTHQDTLQTYLNLLKTTSSVHIGKTTGWETWGCSLWTRLLGDLFVAFQCLKGAYKKSGDKLFSRAFYNYPFRAKG